MAGQEQAPPPRRLEIDLSDLEMAFDDASSDRTYYLDRETGRVIMVTEDHRFELRKIDDLMYGEGNEPRMSFEAALDQVGPPVEQEDATVLALLDQQVRVRGAAEAVRPPRLQGGERVGRCDRRTGPLEYWWGRV